MNSFFIDTDSSAARDGSGCFTCNTPFRPIIPAVIWAKTDAGGNVVDQRIYCALCGEIAKKEA
jgi:hypothetical protein